MTRMSPASAFNRDKVVLSASALVEERALKVSLLNSRYARRLGICAQRVYGAKSVALRRPRCIYDTWAMMHGRRAQRQTKG